MLLHHDSEILTQQNDLNERTYIDTNCLGKMLIISQYIQDGSATKVKNQSIKQ